MLMLLIQGEVGVQIMGKLAYITLGRTLKVLSK